MRSINNVPHRNRHRRRRRRWWWWRHHDGRRPHHDRRRLNHDRCGRHNRRRRHHRRTVVRVSVGVIPDLPIPATPVMWMRRRASPPTAQTRRWHTTMKYVVRRRSAMRSRTMPRTTMVSRMPQFGICMVLSRHRTGTGLLLRLYGVRHRFLLGMSGRMLRPDRAVGDATRNDSNDYSFHCSSPFFLQSTNAFRRCARRFAQTVS